MWLRWVVANLLSELAEKKVRETVDTARRTIQRHPPSVSTPTSPNLSSDVVALFALALESHGLLDIMKQVVTTHCASYVEHVGLLNDRSLMVAESGVGAAAAAKATEDVIELHQPNWIISAGFAGSLVETVRRGDILMASEIVDQSHTVLRVPFNIDPQVVEATAGLHVGRLLTVDRVVVGETDKRQLASQFQAVGCDMETAAVASVCRERHVRFLSLRVISDGVNDVLPPEIAHLVDQQTVAAKIGAATRALFHRPGSVKDMWRLRDLAATSSERLAQFMCGVVPQLEPKKE